MFGPVRKKKLGKPATAVPKYAWALSCHTSDSRRPSLPRRCCEAGMSVTWKPVPRISESTAPLGAVGGDDRVRLDLLDAVGHQLDVGLADRGVPVVGRQDALAAEGVVRRQPGSQRGIGHLPAEVAPRDALDRLHHPLVAREAEHQPLAPPVDGRADGALERREAAVEPSLDLRHGPVAVGHDPRRRALEDVQLLDLRLDARHVLDRGRAGADRGDALALQVHVVIPAGRVEHRPLEALDAGNGGQLRLGERSEAADQDLSLDLALARLDQPAALLVVPVRPRATSWSKRMCGMMPNRSAQSRR